MRDQLVLAASLLLCSVILTNINWVGVKVMVVYVKKGYCTAVRFLAFRWKGTATKTIVTKRYPKKWTGSEKWYLPRSCYKEYKPWKTIADCLTWNEYSLDTQFWPQLSILGIDFLGLVNSTCKVTFPWFALSRRAKWRRTVRPGPFRGFWCWKYLPTRAPNTF